MSEAVKQKPHAFDAFLHLVTYFAMVMSAVAAGTIIFQIINRYAPDLPAAYYNYQGEPAYRGPVRFGIATLLLTGPLFLILTGYLHRQFRDSGLNPSSGVRRWLTYVMLFAAAVNIIGSTIGLLNGFLAGSYTANFVLKMLTILGIAAAIFGFYLGELRRSSYAQRHVASLPLLVATSVLFAVLVVVGFTLIGSPLEARRREFDLRRSNNAQQLRWMLEEEYRRRGTVPQTVEAIDPALGLDPETGQPFGYTKLADNRYQLCVTFALVNDPMAPSKGVPVPRPDAAYVGSPDQVWVNHGAGEECHTFTLTRLSPEGQGIIDTQVDDQAATTGPAPKQK